MNSTHFHKTEGIILRATPFRDYDHILTLFTPDAGLIQLMVYGSQSKKKGGQALYMPLIKVESVYQEKGGEIFSCKELSLIDSYPYLRKELRYLEAACDLLKCVSGSQLNGKPAPLLYLLLSRFLEKIPEAQFPEVLAAAFRLKILMHEGVATFPFVCSSCQELLLTEGFTSNAEGWCFNHRPPASLAWNQTQLETIYRLASSRSYQEICAEEATPQLMVQITRFFEEVY